MILSALEYMPLPNKWQRTFYLVLPQSDHYVSARICFDPTCAVCITGIVPFWKPWLVICILADQIITMHWAQHQVNFVFGQSDLKALQPAIALGFLALGFSSMPLDFSTFSCHFSFVECPTQFFWSSCFLPSWIDPLFCWSKHSPLASWEADFENYIFDSLHVRNLFSYPLLWLNCARACTLNLEIILLQILKIIIPLSPNHQCLYCEVPYLSDSWHHLPDTLDLYFF